MSDTTELAQPATDAPRMVRVKCIVHTLPWTEEKPLEFKETAVVTPETATLMESRDQVVIMGDA